MQLVLFHSASCSLIGSHSEVTRSSVSCNNETTAHIKTERQTETEGNNERASRGAWGRGSGALAPRWSSSLFVYHKLSALLLYRWGIEPTTFWLPSTFYLRAHFTSHQSQSLSVLWSLSGFCYSAQRRLAAHFSQLELQQQQSHAHKTPNIKGNCLLNVTYVHSLSYVLFRNTL